MSGGLAHLMRAQFTPSKKGCCFISVAPRLYPSRCCGSLTSNPLIMSLAEKLTIGDSGNLKGWPTTLKSVAPLPEVVFKLGIKCHVECSDTNKKINDASLLSLINLSLAYVYCSTTLSNHGLIKLKKFVSQSSRNLYN